MYLVNFITKTNSNNKVAVSSPKELFELVYILDEASHVIAWKPVEWLPEDFGWAKDGWNKLRRGTFTTEDYKQSR